MKKFKISTATAIAVYAILAVVFYGCSEKPKLEKPFIVVKIEYGSQENETYTYQDANGVRETFYTKRHSFSVGDTLK